MKNDRCIVPKSLRPAWLEYPQSFVRLTAQDLTDLTPWHVLDAEKALTHYEGLVARFPTRYLFPFAYRQDNDDIACWARDMGDKVLIIHDFASPGFEDEGSFENFSAWFRSAVEETIEWD